MNCTNTCKFQRELLVQEGLEQRVPFGEHFDLSGWGSVLGQLSKKFVFSILECEALEEKDFAIGRILETTPSAVIFQYFSGSADWADCPESIALEDLTCCQVDNNYLNVYRRHFERTSVWSADQRRR